MRTFAVLAIALFVAGCQPLQPMPRAMRPSSPAGSVEEPLPPATDYSEFPTVKPAPGRTAPVTARDLGHIVNLTQLEHLDDHFNNGIVSKQFSCQLMNDTFLELKSVTIRFKVVERDTQRLVFAGPPIRITAFHNELFSSIGSLLPENISVVHRLPFNYPSDDWRVGTIDVAEVVAAEAYLGPQDLHSATHLYTFIFRSKPSEALAMFKAHPDLVKVKTTQNATALHMALAMEDVPTVEYLESLGASLKDITSGKSGAMHMAARNTFHPEVRDYVLSKGFKVDARNDQGRTPLCIAAQTGTIVAVQWFVKHGAEPDALDIAGHPPMYYAMNMRRPDMMDALVALGANPRFHDRDGFGWLHYATMYGQFQDRVANYGVPIEDEVGPNHMTPLLLAAQIGYSDSQIWLLQHGADPYRKNSKGENCFDLAEQSNTLHTDQFFRESVDKYWTGRKKT